MTTFAAGSKKLQQRFEQMESLRRALQRESSSASRLAKQAIFSLQRGDAPQAKTQLAEAEAQLKRAHLAIKKEPKLLADASWRAALEEFCEAVLVDRAVHGKALFPLPELTEEPDIVLGALSDLAGELVRLAVHSATEGDTKKVDEWHKLAEEVVVYLTSLDLTGSLRSKGDQARGHLRRLEDIRYEVLRRSA